MKNKLLVDGIKNKNFRKKEKNQKKIKKFFFSYLTLLLGDLAVVVFVDVVADFVMGRSGDRDVLLLLLLLLLLPLLPLPLILLILILPSPPAVLCPPFETREDLVAPFKKKRKNEKQIALIIVN